MNKFYCVIAAVVLAAACSAADWPQAGCAPQRTNRNAAEQSPPPGTPWRLLWHKNFWPDRVHNAVQAVAVGERVYVGSKDGAVFCLNAADGQDVWTARGLGCIVNSLAWADGTILVASLDGMHGLSAQDGRKLWTVERPGGFTVAPLVAEGRVFAGSRLGKMLCVNPADGVVVWESDTGSYILQSAAYDNGRIFFATEDLFMRCLTAKTGRELWKSGPFCSQSFVYFYPVIHQGYVLFRGMITQVTILGYESTFYPFIYGSDKRGKEIAECRPRLAAIFAEGKAVPEELEWEQGQIQMSDYLKANRWQQDLWALNAESGQEEFLLPHFPAVGSLGLGGPLAPPAVDRDGMIVIHTVFGGHNFGRLDLKKQRIIDLLLDKDDKVQTEGNSDEFRSISTAGDEIFMAHAGQHEGAVRLHHGVFDLRTRKWTPFDNSRFAGTGSWFEHQGSPPAVANGRFFHISYTQMNAYGWK